VKRTSALLAAAILTMIPMPTTGFAADFPYTGYYTAAEGLSSEVAQQKCALSFFVQHADGSGSNYMLDVEKFLKSTNISYIKASDFSCRYDETKKIDSCSYTSIDAQGETKTKFFDYYDGVTPTQVTGFFFADQKQLDSFIENQMKPDASSVRLVFVRCSDFTHEITAKYISQETNAFSRDRTTELTLPDMSAESGNREIADRVLQQIKSDQ
jgi:hypothetical protein